MDELLDLARSGNKGAESELFKYLLVRFQLLAKKRIREEEAALDIAQAACLTVAEKYRCTEFPNGFESWAYEVLRNKIGNHLQVMQADRRRLSHTDNPGQVYGSAHIEPDHDLRMAIVRCLRRILRVKRRYARVLNLVHQGYDAGDICDRIECSRNNFYVILNRARRLMRNCLANGGL
jgi:RNA polymerase sigma factor (sigma-70 family)